MSCDLGPLTLCVMFLNSLNTMKTKAVKTKSCAQCAHWNALDNSTGECRRHAPQTIAFEVDEEVKFESKFPVTAGNDWCGDFSKADD